MTYPVAGIVAEYNPLHSGHAKHIAQTKALCGARAAVAVLSSCFVQRGEPALLDKWTRARMAVACGCDLVLELPVLFSSHNAGVFSKAAVDILAASGVVTHISFGAEDPERLTDSIVDILLNEPESFKLSLKKYLKSGLSFVEARARAADELLPGAAELLAGSNNTLALGYLMRIKEKGYHLRALPVKREGASYNSTDISQGASSAAVRAALRRGDKKAALDALPRASGEILETALREGRACVSSSLYWRLLRAMLIRAGAEDLAQCAEISEGMENLMISAAKEASSFEEWTDACVSKRYPAGRVRRAAAHALLSVGHWSNRAAQRIGSPYIRPLAMNAEGRKLLAEMRKTSALPIVTTCGQAASLSRYAAEVMRTELLACELWEEIVPNGSFGAEHKRKIIIEG